MTWTRMTVAPDGSHHRTSLGEPAYAERFDAVLKFHAPGLAPVRRGNEAWHIHPDGSPAYARRFESTFGFYEGLAAVADAGGWHHITGDGLDAYADRYAWCGNFQGLRCAVRDNNGAYLHIHPDGRPVYADRWRYAGDYRDGVSVAQATDGRSTHLDEAGRLVHGRWFEDLDVFHKAFARARDGDGWTHVDVTGRSIYDRRFAAVEAFYNGQARVERFDGALEVIAESGATLIELRPPRRSAAAGSSASDGHPQTAAGAEPPSVDDGRGDVSKVIEWRIPPSVLMHLERVPRDRPVILLLRHSVRDELPPNDVGYALPITDVGERLARQLGTKLRGRLHTLRASPLVRCVQTAEALRDGAGSDGGIVTDRLLGDPGVFVLDGRRAWSHWERMGHEGVMRHLVAEDVALAGMARADEAARFLVHHMLAAAGDVPGVHVFVTHDSLVTATAARLLARPLGTPDWPWYLEGAFFWRATNGLCTAYRDHERISADVPLCALRDGDVIELARREIASTVGLDSGARFFLAGGAFKTLLTGRAPRDLDLWAASDADRTLLLRALDERGARRLADRPFADAFEIADRVVEVPHKVEPPDLDGRLQRFDLALSAVGVEHGPNDEWRASVHPLALESVRRREVLLLKPLVNWKYALTTLERLRRYASELAFAVSAEEEAEVWRVFDGQPPDIRQGMLERYQRTALGGFGVGEEAACRFP